MTTTARTPVELWVDPACPWAWLTSRWLLEAARVRELDLTFSVMSLAVLNEDRELSEDYAASMRRSWGPVRVLVAALQASGQDVVIPLYTALGTRIHVQGRTADRTLVEEVLVEAGLPVALAEAMDTGEYDEQIRKCHQRAMDLVGTDVGTPVIAVGEVALFGPVVTPAPKGEAAGRLWDGFLLVGQTPGFYELKRSRTSGPVFD